MTENTFPPVSSLFSETWLIFKKTWVKLFIATLLFYVAYIVFSGIAVLVALPAGVLAFISSGGKNLAALGSSIILLGADAIIWMVLMIITSIILQVATIRIVAAEGKDLSYGYLIKDGYRKVLPLLGLGIVTAFLLWGGLFLFVIPAFVFAYLFIFSQYALVLEETSILGALKRSMTIASAHFGEVFIRLLVFFGIQILFGTAYLIVSTMISALTGLGTVASGNDASVAMGFMSGRMGLNFLLSIVSALWGWYCMAFVYVIYKQASERTPKTETRSLKAAFIISLIGWVLGMVTITLSVRAISSYIDSKAIEKKQVQQENDPIRLEQMVFSEINKQRDLVKLSPAEEDQLLCTYAERRLDQLKAYGGFDGHRGFVEDNGDEKILRAYFSDYATYNETYTSSVAPTQASTIVAGWVKIKNSPVLDKTVTNICARANSKFLVVLYGMKNTRLR